VFQGRTLNVRTVEERSAAATPKVAGSKGVRPCFDFARGKCSKGAACKWAHVKPAAAASFGDTDVASSRRPEWQKKRPLAIAEETMQDIPEDYCRKFQLGKCHRGAGCRWKHELWKPKGAAPTSKESSRDVSKRPRGDAHNGPDENSLGTTSAKLSKQDKESRVAELRDAISRREKQWRIANDASSKDPIPAAVKNKDMIWRAMERTLERLA